MKLLKIFVFVFCLTTYYILHTTYTHAQVPPNNPPVECYETDDPEFHSLRPYQASATCKSEMAKYASFCGNDLTLKDTVTAQYPDGGGICRQEEEKIICKFSVSASKDITIDLSGAELPIMGNTEDVVNSQSSTETLGDAQKVNEYVSWYLNGNMNRAEYGENKNTDYNAVNFSGPIQKLLPSVIQETQRIYTIQASSETRHNQIVVCAQEGILGIWGKTKPHECYEGDGSIAKPNVYRLENWNGDLSELRTILNLMNPLDAWNKRIPPLPWNFESNILYKKAYNEWKGKSCLILPTGNFICFDNPLIRNKWADLFPYVPLSSTEDRKGGVMIDNISSTTQPGSGVAVSNVSFSNQKPADLFFSHMQETDDLAGILQDTFVSTDEEESKAGAPTGVDPANCSTLDVRSNKGDDLFAGEITGNLKYKAAFSCEFAPRPPSRIPGPPQTCSKDIYIALSTKSAVPNIENVWSRLVAGPASIFKRIFPKLGAGSGIGSIKDIPGSTAINFSGEGINESTDLKLPHIGGISEYFLKGIQTILRPKGYGEAISFGAVSGGQCIPNEGSVDAAIADAASKYGVQAGLLRAIFWIEGVEYIANPQNYVCEENWAGAAGVMQITPGAYLLVTCENERMANSLAACSEPGKLSRCVIHDAFELAARVLLSRVGLWSYSDCKPLSAFPNNKQDIYNAACRYYGSFSPDTWTIHAAQQHGLPDPNNKNYCDVVCYLMGLCPPFPSH